MTWNVNEHDPALKSKITSYLQSVSVKNTEQQRKIDTVIQKMLKGGCTVKEAADAIMKILDSTPHWKSFDITFTDKNGQNIVVKFENNFFSNDTVTLLEQAGNLYAASAGKGTKGALFSSIDDAVRFENALKSARTIELVEVTDQRISIKIDGKEYKLPNTVDSWNLLINTGNKDLLSSIRIFFVGSGKSLASTYEFNPALKRFRNEKDAIKYLNGVELIEQDIDHVMQYSEYTKNPQIAKAYINAVIVGLKKMGWTQTQINKFITRAYQRNIALWELKQKYNPDNIRAQEAMEGMSAELRSYRTGQWTKEDAAARKQRWAAYKDTAAQSIEAYKKSAYYVSWQSMQSVLNENNIELVKEDVQSVPLDTFLKATFKFILPNKMDQKIQDLYLAKRADLGGRSVFELIAYKDYEAVSGMKYGTEALTSYIKGLQADQAIKDRALAEINRFDSGSMKVRVIEFISPEPKKENGEVVLDDNGNPVPEIMPVFLIEGTITDPVTKQTTTVLIDPSTGSIYEGDNLDGAIEKYAKFAPLPDGGYISYFDDAGKFHEPIQLEYTGGERALDVGVALLNLAGTAALFFPAGQYVSLAAFGVTTAYEGGKTIYRAANGQEVTAEEVAQLILQGLMIYGGAASVIFKEGGIVSRISRTASEAGMVGMTADMIKMTVDGIMQKDPAKAIMVLQSMLILVTAAKVNNIVRMRSVSAAAKELEGMGYRRLEGEVGNDAAYIKRVANEMRLKGEKAEKFLKSAKVTTKRVVLEAQERISNQYEEFLVKGKDGKYHKAESIVVNKKMAEVTEGEARTALEQGKVISCTDGVFVPKGLQGVHTHTLTVFEQLMKNKTFKNKAELEAFCKEYGLTVADITAGRNSISFVCVTEKGTLMKVDVKFKRTETGKVVRDSMTVIPFDVYGQNSENINRYKELEAEIQVDDKGAYCTRSEVSIRQGREATYNFNFDSPEVCAKWLQIYKDRYGIQSIMSKTDRTIKVDAEVIERGFVLPKKGGGVYVIPEGYELIGDELWGWTGGSATGEHVFCCLRKNVDVSNIEVVIAEIKASRAAAGRKSHWEGVIAQ